MSGYDWLKQEPAPRMLVEALKLNGIRETAGDKHNPIILGWAKECGIPNYTNDEIPWCGLFMAVVAKRAGKPFPENPLWARNWAKWGDLTQPELGCVLVFARGGAGHVGLYVGEDKDCFHVYGGNQSDSVGITRISKTRLLSSRNMYKIGKPPNVRIIYLEPTGSVSSNEV